jgi:3-dehydroquinate synthase
MLDPKQDASWIESHHQSFSINYSYPVYFTRDLFDPCLGAALSAIEPEKPRRFAMFVDEGVTIAAPNLLARITRYAAAHASTMALAGDIVLVTGGKSVENQRDGVEAQSIQLSAGSNAARSSSR